MTEGPRRSRPLLLLNSHERIVFSAWMMYEESTLLHSLSYNPSYNSPSK